MNNLTQPISQQALLRCALGQIWGFFFFFFFYFLINLLLQVILLSQKNVYFLTS